MILKRLPLIAVLLTGISSLTHGAGLIVVSDPDGAQLRGLPNRVIEMVSHHAKVQIDDQFATTTVAQEFRNPTGTRLEGTFLFPVPKGAQLKTFTMEINGEPIEAELLGSAKARKIYEDIVRRQRDPALLEFVDQDLYKVRIFPIEPRETKRITLSYGQLLKSEFGLVSYVYPMSVERFSAKPIDRVSLDIALKTRKDLKTIYSSTHDVEVHRRGKRKASIGYENDQCTAERDFELFFSREDEGIGMSLLTYRPRNDEDGYFLLLASPGEVDDPDKVLPKNVVFVIDTSGSMASGKLDQARKALRFCVENLNDKDRFEIVRFSSGVEPLFNGFQSATPQRRKQAVQFVDQMKPHGGTAIDDALTHAMSMGVQRIRGGSAKSSGKNPTIVVFLTDGQPTVGERNVDKIVSNVTSKDANKRVFCFGIGTDVNTHLLDRITEKTRATSEYVLPNEDLEVKVSNFFSKIKDPVLTHPTLSFPERAGARLMFPSPLPDVFSGEQLVVVGQYSSQTNGAVELAGQSDGKKRSYYEDVKFSANSKKHDFIAKLWATRRIGWLVNETRLRGESEELKEEITTLARTHGIVTPYTAWLIVEDEERRGVRPALRTLRQTSRNQAALDYSESNYRNLSKQQTGEDATLSARYGGASVQTKIAAPHRDAVEYDEVFLQRYGLMDQKRRSTTALRENAIRGQAQPNTFNSVPDSLEMESVALPSDLAKESRVVAGKTFFHSDGQWLDVEIQKQQNEKRVKIEFNSEEYFKLLRKHSNIPKWLAIGAKVQFYFDGTIYVIE